METMETVKRLCWDVNRKMDVEVELPADRGEQVKLACTHRTPVLVLQAIGPVTYASARR